MSQDGPYRKLGSLAELGELTGKRVVAPPTNRYIQTSVAHHRKVERLKNQALAEKKAKQKQENIARHEELVRRQKAEAEAKKLKSRELHIKFGEAIKNKREALGIPRDRLAEIIGIHYDLLGRVEAGEQCVYFDVGLRVCKLLQIRLEHLWEAAHIDEWKAELAKDVEAQAKAVESEMAELEKKMAALKDKKNLIARVAHAAVVPDRGMPTI